MAIKFKVLTKSDITERAYPVSTQEDITRSLTKRTTSSEIEDSRADWNVRYYINLAVPCINHVLAGAVYTNLAQVLGLSGAEVSAICTFKTFYDTESEVYITEDELDDSDAGSNILVGGEIIEYLLDKLDMEGRILAILRAFGVKYAGKANVGDCSITQGDGQLLMLGDYYLNFDNEEAAYALNETKPLQDFMFVAVTQGIDANFKKTHMETICTYINLLRVYGTQEAVKEKALSGFLTKSLMVLPLAMRPNSIDHNRKHPMTAAYIKIYNASNSMPQSSRAVGIKAYIRMYERLDTLVSSVQDMNTYGDQTNVRRGKNVVHHDKDLEGMKSALESIKGKNGRIRGTNLSRRQDYSGRSSVIVDPFMSIRKMRIPQAMYPKLFMLHGLRASSTPREDYKKIKGVKGMISFVDTLNRQHVLDSVPMNLGRNPTLHKHGIQGFDVELTDARALEVSPLVCPAYNMDFDGDTGHVEIPSGDLAVQEVYQLIMSSKNILLPQTGECTICPRQDMLFGLYICTKLTKPTGPATATFTTSKEVKDAVFNQDIAIDAVVSCSGGVDYAGNWAVRSCFPQRMVNGPGEESGSKWTVETLNSSTIKPLVSRIAGEPIDTFVSCIDSIVELGFKVAYLYSASVSLFQPMLPDQEYDTAFDVFHATMAEIDELNDIGAYDLESYTAEFDKAYQDLQRSLQKNIMKKIPSTNSFWIMATSGARGGPSNLIQMFAYKGRISKSSTETFNVVIEHSLVDQLNPMEHFIASNGARKGQMEKSISTADTGYLARKVWHSTSPSIITNEDCGTKEGIAISKSDIERFIHRDGANQAERLKEREHIKEIFRFMVAGRYRADSGMMITDEMAVQLADSSADSVVIRSPITCANHCCKKCYGIDPGTNKRPAIGAPIGFAAAHSVGETGTQLTMKQFQTGGVSGGNEVSSNFDRLKSFLSVQDIRDYTTNPTYEPIAWADGVIYELVAQGGVVKEVRLKPLEGTPSSAIYNRSVKMPRSAAIRVGETVRKGDRLTVNKGDAYIPDVIKYVGLRAGQLELLHSLYNVYESERKIVTKHFEEVIASMTRFTVLSTDMFELRIGMAYTQQELATYCRLRSDFNLDKTVMQASIYNIGACIINDPNMMEGLIFENQKHVLGKAVLNACVDTMQGPLPRIALGLPVLLGTGINKAFAIERLG